MLILDKLGKDIQNISIDDLKLFFDHSSLVDYHKGENKKLIFKIGDDPQKYVTKKLAVLNNIDKDMKPHRIIEQLVKGLPMALKLQFSSLEIKDVSQFLNRLRKYAAVLAESDGGKKNGPHAGPLAKGRGLSITPRKAMPRGARFILIQILHAS